MVQIISDPHNLVRFKIAQSINYHDAIREIIAGYKTTHWMWYIFPVFEGISESRTSQYFAIKSIAEARAYLAHPILGPRLRDCAAAAVQVERGSALYVFGPPDDRKLKSCATLFASISKPSSIFHRLLARYFRGRRDRRTLRLIKGK